MEYFVVKQVSASKREHFDSCPLAKSKDDTLIKALSLGVSLVAAFLSWSCNRGTNAVLRVIYALFAFMFGFTYIILYIIFRQGECRAAVKNAIKSMNSKI